MSEFGSDIGLSPLLVAVSLHSVSVGSDTRLRWLLVAVSLCSVLGVCVCVFCQISGAVGSVICFSYMCAWVCRYRALSVVCGRIGFGSDIGLS